MFVDLTPEFISRAVCEEFKVYAVTKYPYEACAYIIDNQLVPVDNKSEEPELHFQLSRKDSLLANKAQAFLHSHTNGRLIPSAPDMQTQITCGIPFGIVTVRETEVSNILWWGDHTLDYPLLERPYIHCVLDCYSIIRGAFWQERGIKLKDYPRVYGWWNKGENLYEENIRDGGGIEVDDLQPYDIIFMKMVSSHTDHAALYRGDGMILHHTAGKLSRIDPLIRYRKHIEKIVRYID